MYIGYILSLNKLYLANHLFLYHDDDLFLHLFIVVDTNCTKMAVNQRIVGKNEFNSITG